MLKFHSKNLESFQSNEVINLEMENIEGKKSLLSQEIDIFNLSSPFFNDICFNFDSPNGKDITLKQRITI